MKRLTSILLLLLFVYNFIGAGLLYNVWLYTAKQKAEKKIEKVQQDDITIIKIAKELAYTSSKLQWHEDHEFRFQGQMYDIIKKEERGDKIWFYCYWDKDETKVLNQLSSYVADFVQQQSDHTSSQKIFPSILDKLFLIYSSPTIPNIHLALASFTPNAGIPITQFLDIDSPPPKWL